MASSSADRSRLQTEDNAATTMEFIQEARRPILIVRHQTMIEEMESSLADQFITGDSDHPRVKAMLADLDAPEMTERLRIGLATLADDGHYREATLRQALVEELCLWRERAGQEVAQLQLYAIGMYRLVRRCLAERQGGDAPTLDELRELPAARLGQLLSPPAAGFAQPVLNQLRTKGYADRSLKAVKRLVRQANAEERWDDAGGEPTLTREEEEPLLQLPESERKATRELLVRDRIRSRFYRQVFLQYLGSDEFDPREAEAHPHVLHWLQTIDETPHLYSFLQGQAAGQKAFRISQLTQKIVQLHEVYARIAHASDNPAHRAQLAGKSARERLAIINRLHYPPLPGTPDLTLAALLCPFPAFVAWIQGKVAANDLVVPPDARR
jgi:hypothetical protein